MCCKPHSYFDTCALVKAFDRRRAAAQRLALSEACQPPLLQLLYAAGLIAGLGSTASGLGPGGLGAVDQQSSAAHSSRSRACRPQLLRRCCHRPPAPAAHTYPPPHRTRGPPRAPRPVCKNQITFARPVETAATIRPSRKPRSDG